jgi:hypothetical protein
MKKTFRPWDVSQGNRFPPAPKGLVPPDRLSHFIPGSGLGGRRVLFRSEHRGDPGSKPFQAVDRQQPVAERLPRA